MSKMDELRALREARYQQEAAGAKKSAPKAPRPAAEAKAKPPAGAEKPTADPAPAGTQLCGHRSMNGRTCTREQGHAAKSHRYS